MRYAQSGKLTFAESAPLLVDFNAAQVNARPGRARKATDHIRTDDCAG